MDALPWFVQLKNLPSIAEFAVIAYPSNRVQLELPNPLKEIHTAKGGIGQHPDFAGSFQPFEHAAPGASRVGRQTAALYPGRRESSRVSAKVQQPDRASPNASRVCRETP